MCHHIHYGIIAFFSVCDLMFFAFSELGIFEILISQNMCRVSFCQLPEIQSKRFLDALPNYIPITETGAGEKKWSWGRRGDYEQPPGR